MEPEKTVIQWQQKNIRILQAKKLAFTVGKSIVKNVDEYL